MITTNERIISVYKMTESIKMTAKLCGISHSTVKKRLLTEGLYTNARIKQVNALLESGLSVDDIAEALDISRDTVTANMPYVRRSYVSDQKTENALRIAKWRQRKSGADKEEANE